MTAYVVFGHGSSIESANDAVRAAARELGRRAACDVVETAFLEGGQPDLETAVNGLVSRGAARIVVIPYFLTLGLHLQRDLPRIVQRLRDIHLSVIIEVTPPLDGHPALVDALVDRARGSQIEN